MLLSHVLPLKEEREEDEGASRSPLGAKQEAFRDVFGLRWTKKTATSVGGGAHAIRLMCTRTLITGPFTGPIRGECDTHSCPGALSYDRLGMNRKRPTAYDGSGALFLGRRRIPSVSPLLHYLLLWQMDVGIAVFTFFNVSST